jgi:hypothetical protein
MMLGALCDYDIRLELSYFVDYKLLFFNACADFSRVQANKLNGSF